MTERWPPGAATGVGSLPGVDPLAAARLVAAELPDFPHLPELPARGPGAGIVGRGAALLADLYADLQPAGWRLVARPGLDSRRARDHLRRDLDALTDVFAGYAGPFKCQAAGPWTLAAGLELTRGDRALADRGARRDLATALAEGLRAHVAELRRRLPGADLVLQVDEPSLPAVRDGRVPTASGFGALAPVDDEELLDGWRAVLGAASVPVGVHCCAPDPPLDLLGRAGFDFVSVDVTLLRAPAYDDLAGLVEKGVGLFAGTASVEPVTELWRRIGLAPRVVVTPTCGLAGSEEADAVATLRQAREIARRLAEESG